MTEDLSIEPLQITVSTIHRWTGDLGVELVAPSGTKSVLLTIRNGFASTTGLHGMVLASNAFYGERSKGDWTIPVIDGERGNTGVLTNWQIRVFGH